MLSLKKMVASSDVSDSDSVDSQQDPGSPKEQHNSPKPPNVPNLNLKRSETAELEKEIDKIQAPKRLSHAKSTSVGNTRAKYTEKIH